MEYIEQGRRAVWRLDCADTLPVRVVIPSFAVIESCHYQQAELYGEWGRVPCLAGQLVYPGEYRFRCPGVLLTSGELSVLYLSEDELGARREFLHSAELRLPVSSFVPWGIQICRSKRCLSGVETVLNPDDDVFVLAGPSGRLCVDLSGSAAFAMNDPVKIFAYCPTSDRAFYMEQVATRGYQYERLVSIGGWTGGYLRLSFSNSAGGARDVGADVWTW